MEKTGILNQAASAKKQTELGIQEEENVLNNMESVINKNIGAAYERIDGVSTENGGEWEFDKNTNTITGYVGDKTEIVIPNYIDGVAVYNIGQSAISGNQYITSIDISDGIITIEEKAFEDCYSLQNVRIGNTVTSIGDYAFATCSNDGRGNITISDSVTDIGYRAFSYCGTAYGVNITMGNGITNIEDEAFYQSGIEEVSIKSNVENFGNNVFYNCMYLGKVTIGGNVKKYR